MVQIYKQMPRSPRAAARRRANVDRRLDTALFRAIGDPTRARLLACLVKCGRPCSVSEVAECCAVDFSVVARHLTVLARVGVLHVEKEGRTVWYKARSRELAAKLRALADAFDEWCAEAGTACCTPEAGAPCCATPITASKDKK